MNTNLEKCQLTRPFIADCVSEQSVFTQVIEVPSSMRLNIFLVSIVFYCASRAVVVFSRTFELIVVNIMDTSS